MSPIHEKATVSAIIRAAVEQVQRGALCSDHARCCSPAQCEEAARIASLTTSTCTLISDSIQFMGATNASAEAADAVPALSNLQSHEKTDPRDQPSQLTASIDALRHFLASERHAHFLGHCASPNSCTQPLAGQAKSASKLAALSALAHLFQWRGASSATRKAIGTVVLSTCQAAPEWFLYFVEVVHSISADAENSASGFLSRSLRFIIRAWYHSLTTTRDLVRVLVRSQDEQFAVGHARLMARAHVNKPRDTVQCGIFALLAATSNNLAQLLSNPPRDIFAAQHQREEQHCHQPLKTKKERKQRARSHVDSETTKRVCQLMKTFPAVRSALLIAISARSARFARAARRLDPFAVAKAGVTFADFGGKATKLHSDNCLVFALCIPSMCVVDIVHTCAAFCRHGIFSDAGGKLHYNGFLADVWQAAPAEQQQVLLKCVNSIEARAKAASLSTVDLIDGKGGKAVEADASAKEESSAQDAGPSKTVPKANMNEQGQNNLASSFKDANSHDDDDANGDDGDDGDDEVPPASEEKAALGAASCTDKQIVAEKADDVSKSAIPVFDLGTMAFSKKGIPAPPPIVKPGSVLQSIIATMEDRLGSATDAAQGGTDCLQDPLSLHLHALSIARGFDIHRWRKAKRYGSGGKTIAQLCETWRSPHHLLSQLLSASNVLRDRFLQVHTQSSPSQHGARRKVQIVLNLTANMDIPVAGTMNVTAKECILVAAYHLYKLAPATVQLVTIARGGMARLLVSPQDTFAQFRAKADRIQAGGMGTSFPIQFAADTRRDVDLFIFLSGTLGKKRSGGVLKSVKRALCEYNTSMDKEAAAMFVLFNARSSAVVSALASKYLRQPHEQCDVTAPEPKQQSVGTVDKSGQNPVRATASEGSEGKSVLASPKPHAQRVQAVHSALQPRVLRLPAEVHRDLSEIAANTGEDQHCPASPSVMCGIEPTTWHTLALSVLSSG